MAAVAAARAVAASRATAAAPAAAARCSKGGSGKASRSIEEIKLVFERNKGAIYAIYNRALREDPSLQGKVVVELKIAPSGEVVDVRVLSSELKASELESKLLARIKAVRLRRQGRRHHGRVLAGGLPAVLSGRR